MGNETVVKEVLAHHGTKGMKWGSRKSRSGGKSEVAVKTGKNLIGKTVVKTSGGEGHPAHPDAIAAKVVQQKLKESGKHSLSNAEIQSLVNRRNLEQQLSSKVSTEPQAVSGAKFAVKFLNTPEGKKSVKSAHAVGKAVINTKPVRKALATTATAATLATAR